MFCLLFTFATNDTSYSVTKCILSIILTVTIIWLLKIQCIS